MLVADEGRGAFWAETLNLEAGLHLVGATITFICPVCWQDLDGL